MMHFEFEWFGSKCSLSINGIILLFNSLIKVKDIQKYFLNKFDKGIKNNLQCNICTANLLLCILSLKVIMKSKYIITEHFIVQK